MEKNSNDFNWNETSKKVKNDAEQQQRKLDLLIAQAKKQSDQITEIEDCRRPLANKKSKKKINLPM